MFAWWAKTCEDYPPCRDSAEAGAAYEEYLELKYDKMAEDPPDSDYTMIAKPITPTTPPLGTASGLTKTQAAAFNGLYHNFKVQMGLLTAIMTSVNRASGAANASNSYWQHRQQQAAAEYSLALAAAIKREGGLRQTLEGVLTGSGFKSYAVTAYELYQFQIGLDYSFGLGSENVTILKELGLTSKQIARIKAFIVAQNSNEVMNDVGAYGIPGFITSPIGAGVRKNAISAFEQFAKDNGYPPPDCSKAAPSVETIWPPNNKFVPVTVTGITDSAGLALTLDITKIQQDEPISHGRAVDGKGVGSSTALVRATRNGKGSGRIYFITVKATDPYGESCSATVDVQVPHDVHHAVKDTGKRYSSTGG